MKILSTTLSSEVLNHQEDIQKELEQIRTELHPVKKTTSCKLIGDHQLNKL